MRFPSISVLAALLCACACASAAAEDDAINPDRPSVAESAQTVGHGRVQLETGLQWDRQRDSDLHQRTLTTPTLLRIGIGEASELRLETDGRTIVHASDPASGERFDAAGYADTSVGVKWQLAEQAGNRPSLGVLVDALLPSGSRDLRGSGVRPSLRIPAGWDLAGGWDLTVMPGIGIDSSDTGGRFGYGVLAVELDKALNERAHAFFELAAPQLARAANGGTTLVADTGLTWLVNKDCQVDVVLAHGLNRRSPDLSLGFGISIRR